MPELAFRSAEIPRIRPCCWSTATQLRRTCGPRRYTRSQIAGWTRSRPTSRASATPSPTRPGLGAPREALERFRDAGLGPVALGRPRLGRADRPALGLRPPRRGAGARRLSNTGFFADGTLARDGRACARRARASSSRRDDPRRLRRRCCGPSRGIDATSAWTSTGRPSPTTAAPRDARPLPLRRLREARALRGQLAALGVPFLRCGARTTRSRPIAGAPGSRARSPGAEVEVIPGTGHFIYDDAPEPAANALAEWLSARASGSSG